jgi:hypothetical protein
VVEVQISEEVNSVKALPAKPERAPSLRLTSRDYQLFALLLEQGFLTLEAAYLALFDSRKSPSDPFPRNLEVTRQRLRLLEKWKLIATHPAPMQSKSVYLLARRGYLTLVQKLPERAFAPPPRVVDLGTFEHDKAITFTRIALEKSGKAFGWYPEHRIRFEGFTERRRSLPEGLIPDGLFLNSKGERIALEVEPARKARARYERKMREYRYAMREGLIQKVLYVTRRPDIAKEILDASRGNENVLIEHYDHFLSRLFPPGVQP